MNRWLYRAAGTVGIAGGFLLLGAGSAQADETEGTDALLGDVFSPTAGLPPLDLPAGSGRGGPLGGVTAPDASTLTLDPNDGRLAEPELLPALPLGGLDSLLSTLPLDSVPLDAAGLPGGAIGTGGPLAGDLLRVDGDPVGLPTRFADTGFRTLPAPAPMAPAPMAAAPMAAAPAAPAPAAPVEATGPAEIVGPMPFLTEPLTSALLAGQSLGDLVTIGDLMGQVPVAGPMVSQTAGNLPLVSEIVPQPHHHRAVPPPGADPLTGAITGDQLPPVIGQQLAAERGYSPELLDGGLPLVGRGLDPVGQMVGVGNLPKQLPLVGPLAGPILDGLPVVGDPAPAPAAPAPAAPAPVMPVTDPGAITGERPIAGEDPEYAESAYYGYPSTYLGSPELLPGLPELPVSDALGTLRSLPLVGGLAGGLPL